MRALSQRSLRASQFDELMTTLHRGVVVCPVVVEEGIKEPLAGEVLGSGDKVELL